MLIVKAYIANESLGMALVQSNTQNRFDKSCGLSLARRHLPGEISFWSGTH